MYNNKNNIFFKKIIITLIIFVFTINTTNAWLWLTAQNWDLLNIGKWNEMITKLYTKLDQSNVTWTWNISVANSWTGVIIGFTWSVSASSIPYITSGNKFMNVSTSKNFNITGLNFVPTTTVSIPGWPGTINSTIINWPTNLDINVTSASWTWVYDFVLTNGSISNTLWAWNWVAQLTVLPPSTWKDLRLWWDSFTDWNWAWNDIRYRSWMSMSRDSNGMYFNWSNPWSSWVKFESLSWTRGQNKTIEWIFTRPTSSMMIGIGSTATNETSTSQYTQGEVQIYFSSSTNMWGLYWNNWTVWSTWNQSNSSSLTCASNTFKERFTNDWTAGSSVLTLYCLPSANPSDWDDTTNILKTFTVWWTLNPNETNIMPFIIPINGWTQRFIAVKVD